MTTIRYRNMGVMSLGARTMEGRSEGVGFAITTGRLQMSGDERYPAQRPR